MDNVRCEEDDNDLSPTDVVSPRDVAGHVLASDIPRVIPYAKRFCEVSGKPAEFPNPKPDAQASSSRQVRDHVGGSETPRVKGQNLLEELERRMGRKQEASEGRLTSALNEGLRRIEEAQNTQGRNIELLTNAMSIQAARQRDYHRDLERRLRKLTLTKPSQEGESHGAGGSSSF